jgi:hypothetical protein
MQTIETFELRRAVDKMGRAALSTWLCTAFNVLAILVMCFGIGPQVGNISKEMSRVSAETAENRRVVQENRAVILENQRDLLNHRKTIERLNALIDEAVKKEQERQKSREKKP